MAWNAAHDAAWAPVVGLDPDGLSPHQKECERRVTAKLAQRGLKLVNRRLTPDPLAEYSAIPNEAGPVSGEITIVAELVEAGATFWFYTDQTDIASPCVTLRLEVWDTKTPEEHYEAVLNVVEALISGAGAGS